MGTNIYLEWDGMPEEEKQRMRETTFAINLGHLGYLGASTGMERENDVLKTLFPKEYWEAKKPLRYKFKKGWEKACNAVAEYLICVLFDLPFYEEKTKWEGFSKDLIFTLHEAVTWATSLLDFFELGFRKEREGKNPKVTIVV